MLFSDPDDSFNSLSVLNLVFTSTLYVRLGNSLTGLNYCNSLGRLHVHIETCPGDKTSLYTCMHKQRYGSYYDNTPEQVMHFVNEACSKMANFIESKLDPLAIVYSGRSNQFV